MAVKNTLQVTLVTVSLLMYFGLLFVYQNITPWARPRPLSEDLRPLNEDPRPLNEDPRPLNEESRPLNEESRPLNEESRPLNENVSHRRYKPWSYIVVLNYADQLAGAIRRFAQLLYLTAKWKRNGVDPFLLGSGLGIPRKANLDDVLHLSDFYNLSSIEVCVGNTTISSFEDFLVNSTRELVWLNFVKGHKKRDPSIYDCKEDWNATGTFNGYLNRVKSEAIAKYGKNYKFRLVKAVCVEAHYSGFSLDDLERAVSVTAGSEHVRTPTVVIPSWIGLTNQPGAFDFYVKDNLHWSLNDEAVCNVDTLPCTPLILEAADEFKKSLSLSGPFIGVHFRIERLMKRDEQQDSFFDNCVEKTGDVIQGVMRKYNVTSKSVIALNDYSDYGTFVCRGGPRSKCINLRNKIIKRLESWGVRTVSYNPALFNKPRHKGFVSLVEKETLSSADYLVTVGGGTYQTGMEHLFVKKHGGDEKLYRLCNIFGPDHLQGLNISTDI